ncbi:MAG: motility associated factor glycosyltransferase family protein [Spirochaetes bacterium]|nr:motility associated factor glycosyltransferase family protein [Spirochaetota bacterium]
MALGETKGKYAHYRFGYEEGRFSIFAGTEKEKGVSLVSQRDPVREAERHIGPFRLRPGMLAVVAGVSHLPMLEMLAEQLKSEASKGGWILAFEADTELYLALKKSRPDIFAEVAVIVPENLAVMAELVEKIDVENFVGYRVFENKAGIDIDPSFYAQTIGDFKKKLASRFSDLFTRLEFEERWVFNSLSKLSLMHRARPVSALFGLGRGADALIVSTGPSLRDSLAEIKAQRDRYFIACADSAYRVLVRAGIVPHLVFSLDSQAHTTKHFGLLPHGVAGDFPILVCDAVSNPVAARDWQGELAISYTAQFPDDRRMVSPGCDFLEEEGFIAGAVGLVPGDLQSGGSVATSIFDLMRLMDFDRIILVGQDLAYTRREIHTPGTHHTDEWLAKTTNRLQPLENINERVIRRRHTRRETSLTGRPIVTDYILSLYRDWFATAIDRLNSVVIDSQGSTQSQKILNATKDGLQIPGAQSFALSPGSQSAGINGVILEKFLAAKTLQIDAAKIENLSGRMQSALKDETYASGLPFLRYVGRKFAIKAMRTPENKEALLKKQRIKQRNFLNKITSKLYRHG